jgi:hypothetical protein
MPTHSARRGAFFTLAFFTLAFDALFLAFFAAPAEAFLAIVVLLNR